MVSIRRNNEGRSKEGEGEGEGDAAEFVKIYRWSI